MKKEGKFILKTKCEKYARINHKNAKNYVDLSSQVYYNKDSCEPQKVEIKFPESYLPKTPITIWAGIYGDNEINGLTGFVSWKIENLD